MKKIIALLLALTMCISLVACGVNPKKTEAIDAFNSGNTAFNAVASLINENPTLVDEELITLCQEMAAELANYKKTVENDTDYEDSAYDEIITRMGEVEKWANETKTTIEGVIANPGEFKKEQATKAYNKAQEAMNAYATYLEENQDNLDSALLDDYNTKAAALEEVLTAISDDTNVDNTTAEAWDTLIATIEAMEQWAIDALAEQEG